MRVEQRVYARDRHGRAHVLADGDGDVTLCGRRLIVYDDLTDREAMLADARTLPHLCARCVSLGVEP